MAFTLPEDELNIAQALRDAEAQAPKNLKALLIQAATALDGHSRLCEELAADCELALSWRIGTMDSDSRVAEVTQNIRETLARVVERLRA